MLVTDSDPLAARTAATPDRTALIDVESGARWSFAELDDDVSSVAANLAAAIDGDAKERPLRRQIGTFLEPSPRFVSVFHAVCRLGWTIVPMNPDLPSRERQERRRQCDLDLVVVESGSTIASEEFAPPVRPVSDLTAKHEEPFDPVPGPPDETSLIMFTSGTTGDPKGVRLTMENLLASATASAYRLGISPDDQWLCCLPVYHMGGLAPIVRTVCYGTTLVLQRSFDAAATAGVIREHEVTGVSLVPTQLRRLLEQDLGESLETVLLGGAPAQAVLLDQASEAGIPVYPTYGLTETASQVATARPAEATANPGTVGQPLLGTTVRILPVDDRAEGESVEPLPAGEVGEIVLEGPTVTPGYLDPNATEQAFSEYGFHTGDLGYRDEVGRLWIEGRLDDRIQTGGELVAPADVESTLTAHEAVEEAVVVGLPDPEWGERVAALIVGGVDSDELEALCRERLAAYKVPKTIASTDRLPRTASGTIDREQVRSILQGT